MQKFKVIGLLAVLIAVIAPLWAALSDKFGLTTGAVALICAGLYVANGMVVKNGLKITLGFLVGNVWAFCAFQVILALVGAGLNFHVTLFLVLACFALVAVFIACYLDKVFDLSAWLAGWAITLTLLPFAGAFFPDAETGQELKLLLHVAIAMVAGVWLIGVLITSTHKFLITRKKAG